MADLLEVFGQLIEVGSTGGLYKVRLERLVFAYSIEWPSRQRRED